ncbi:protein unc-93 homolog A-like [Lingula anatina]|uniref:Protein unc-93 homolog A-like n=1 Tax=Lingula anatina TaxID=7574 RepID=A0A2R2MQQ0_LINAN|nr:protein unc-93 homolog A-like [Lingula anatina]|eukprot:XP_023932327.1 protein unc-93 homolog A-like [Lingula anatina]
MFAAAGSCNVACLAAMMFYVPSEQTMEFYLVIPFAWGLADSVWYCQMSAYIGHYFPSQKWPVFVTMRNSMNVTFVITFAYTAFICMEAKMYMTLAMMFTSLTSFYVFEVLQRRKAKKAGPTYTYIEKT